MTEVANGSSAVLLGTVLVFNLSARAFGRFLTRLSDRRMNEDEPMTAAPTSTTPTATPIAVHIDTAITAPASAHDEPLSLVMKMAAEKLSVHLWWPHRGPRGDRRGPGTLHHGPDRSVRKRQEHRRSAASTG